ncbi:MAG: GGDEF domain-containing protein [Sulfurimonas sp.]|nr:GGDEF domain-containing protein [Sulfurimonas sp.]
MLLPEIKEREYRFKLALRMGLPIFGLVLALIIHTFISTYENLTSAFYIESAIVLAFSIYFIFYLIYSGFDTKITDNISKVFTRDYLYKYLKKELDTNKNYTLILISCDNINEINNRYGIKNGDKVLYEIVIWINKYLKSKGISNFPIGHIKGGDFIIGLKGKSSQYKTILELMNLKSDEFKIDDIEVIISSAINDTSFSNELEYMVENLFELQDLNRNEKLFLNKDEEIDPSELESYIVNAIKQKSFVITKQDIFNNDNVVIKEYFIKLKTSDSKIIHQKSYMKILDKLRLMSEYDYMVLEKTIQNCSKDNDDIFAINISPTSIRNYTFLTKVKELLSNNKHVKNRVMFILYEKEYYSHLDRYKEILKSLRLLGVQIVIDKVGANHSSFIYLRELEVDAIRIDGIYTKEIKNSKYRNILDGFILIAKTNDIKVWMKMIEDEDSYNKIKNLKVDYFQGKYLAQLEKIYEN